MILKPQLLFTILCLHFLLSHANLLQTYIIQLRPNSDFPSKLHYHLSFLKTSSRLLYSYESAFEGFSARLSTSELNTLKTSKHIVSIKPDRKLHLHTTYSHRFLGLSPSTPNGPWANSKFGRGQIIGLLDTGAWPESPSFDDRNMPPTPRKWRGTCHFGQNFTCNKKLIGARFFRKGHSISSSSEYISPRDSHGHGTHTASTAAGSRVPSAGVFGLGMGDAYGIAPKAHVGIYKVCWFNGCYSSDILAAMDSAIKDGVDVISLSLGGFPVPLYDDTIAVGSFRAVEKGIIVVCSAGNNGPIMKSVANEAPWIITVGASMLDRKFPAVVRLSSGKLLYGESMYPGKRIEKELELVSGEFCLKGSLDTKKVKGKMVVCNRGINGRAEKGQIVKEAGGAAMILTNTEINMEEDSVDVHVLPATLIGSKESNLLKSYMNSTVRAKARIIFGGTVIGKSRAPVVAQFSSRGPSLTDPSILKPDIIAPGVNIIAAWPENLGPSNLPEDSRRVNFTVMSGTSMSCPHVSGVVALIHSVHPRWTPAGIKSSLMTTADVIDHVGKPIMDGDKKADMFAIGAGHVNPGKAIDPGLIYDIKPSDYMTHLCTVGYSDSEVFSITHRNVSCGNSLRKKKGFSLNYPSFSVVFKTGDERRRMRRKVTNVGRDKSVYEVVIEAPEGVSVRVRPSRLMFKRVNQSLSYKVWFVLKKRGMIKNVMFGEGHLAWVERSGFYRVRSPISVSWKSKE